MGTHRNLLAIQRIPAEREIDGDARLHVAPYERRIALHDLSLPKLVSERGVGSIVLRYHHEAGRASVEPMDDSRSQLTPDAAEILNVMQERIDECAPPVTCRRMDNHPRRLVHDDQMRVIVDDRNGKGFRRRFSGTRCGNFQRDDVSRAYDTAGLLALFSEASMPFTDQALYLRPSLTVYARREDAVKAGPGLVGPNDDRDHAGVGWGGSGHGRLGGVGLRRPSVRWWWRGTRPSQYEEHHDARGDKQQRHSL